MIASFCNRLRLTMRTVNTIRLAELTNDVVALFIVNKPGQANHCLVQSYFAI